MSEDAASDWLLHGIAAARANDKEEARMFLERALIDLDVMADTSGEIDSKEREDAWYWLSRITDDPKQRREYLENVLASNPGHPEARRDLAILDGRLKPEDIVNPDRVATPIVPPAAAGIRRYVCPQCGGKLTYDVAAVALTCEYCGYHVAESEAGTAAEQDFTATLYTARAHRWELPAARVVACQSCGAHFSMPPAQATGTCPFCGSAYIAASVDNGELIEPEGVVPFQIDEAGATEHVRQWLGSQHLNKDDLKQARIARPRPVYFPFWTFAMGGELKWRGLVAMPRAIDGQMTWIERDGSELVMIDNELVPASHSLPNALVSALSQAPAEPAGAYALDALAPYADTYLVDWPVEIYQISLADASLVAHARAFDSARKRVLGLFDVRNLSFDSTGILINSYKLVLLPVWVSALHLVLLKKVTTLVVNGQTGAVFGQVPESGLRKWVAGMLGAL